MQMKEALKLQEEWKRKGCPPCKHKHLEKEYDLGADTGDYVCTTCGETRWGRDWNKEGDKA